MQIYIASMHFLKSGVCDLLGCLCSLKNVLKRKDAKFIFYGFVDFLGLASLEAKIANASFLFCQFIFVVSKEKRWSVYLHIYICIYLKSLYLYI